MTEIQVDIKPKPASKAQLLAAIIPALLVGIIFGATLTNPQTRYFGGR